MRVKFKALLINNTKHAITLHKFIKVLEDNYYRGPMEVIFNQLLFHQFMMLLEEVDLFPLNGESFRSIGFRGKKFGGGTLP